jgi:hypothetical protein
MAERSELTDTVKESWYPGWGTDHEVMRVKNTKPGIPLMQESLSKRDAKNRIQAMSPDQRQQFIDKAGIDEVMRILS